MTKNWDKFRESLYYRDEKITIWYDGFPKAKVHLLIVPNDTSITNLSKLTKQHLPLIEHMKAVGNQIIKQLKEEKACFADIKMGFHAKPSLNLLHCHLISTDFVSDCLKTSKHWNSFTTPFFVPISLVIQMLKEKGEVNVSQFEKFEKQKPLICPLTKKTFKTMPELKEYLKFLEMKRMN